ncbi:MAG: replicative DNA helicase, partial [Bacteroidota bacterium]
QAERDIFKISDTQLRRPAAAMSQVVKETIEKLQAIHGRDTGITGVATGFTRLDDMTGGWQPSDLVIIAARPSMGKTAFALSMARNAALHPTDPSGIAIFSLEMSAQQLAQRLLTSEARVDAQAARTGRLRDDDWLKLARAAGRLAEAPIYIDDTPGLGILELRAKCRRLKAEHGIGLVVVDYLQLMHGSKDSGSREQEIAQISRSLKMLAKELDLPVIALSQLSRAVETRGGDKRPQLSDLRESGCLTGDTLVTLADTGRRVPIRDLVGQSGFDVWAADPSTLKMERATVSRAFSTGIKPVFRMTTRSGHQIHATANHKFLTVSGWRRLDELEAGEHLASPRQLGQIILYKHPRKELALVEESGMYGNGVNAIAMRDDVEAGDVYWDEITAIELDGEEEVYDLTVPGPHNFVANDLVVHNSIEQDADVVAFIYRAERYGITVDENGNSTEGLGEIIIGKQRNGPIGNVQLAFVHQFARFENLTTYYADDFNGGFGGGGDDYGYDGNNGGGGGSMAGGDGFGTQPPPSGGDAPF